MKLVIWVAGIVVLAAVVIAVATRSAADDPAVWHVDPATVERTGQPNDYLAAPAGQTAATPDAATPARPLPPREHLFLFDSIARNASRTVVVAGSVDELHVTYAQRSMIFGFPDYITVKAVALDDDTSALIIWSRARYGYSDMGVNKARVEDWLAKLSDADT